MRIWIPTLGLAALFFPIPSPAQEPPKSPSDFIVTNDAEFRRILPEGAKLEKLATGFKFTEGPQWFPDAGGHLIFSDIPNNRLLKWTSKDGVSIFREPSHQANGNTRDREGRLITCEHESHSVTRTEKDGKAAPIAADYNGKPLNSPNDVVVKSDGTIWFTDPAYGLDKRKNEQGGQFLYRINPDGKLTRIETKEPFDQPNGLAFSPDEKKLYVADSGPSAKHIRVFDVTEDNKLTGGSVFAKIDIGGPDGIRCDADGRLWSSAGDGVHVFTPTGQLIAKILTPSTPDGKHPTPANLTFGEDGRTLFVTAQNTLYEIKTSVLGAKR